MSYAPGVVRSDEQRLVLARQWRAKGPRKIRDGAIMMMTVPVVLPIALFATSYVASVTAFVYAVMASVLGITWALYGMIQTATARREIKKLEPRFPEARLLR